MGYINNNFICENKKNKEIIMDIDEKDLAFYDSNSFEKKFILKINDNIDLLKFKQIDDETIIINNKNLIYILKNHNIIGTYYIPKNFKFETYFFLRNKKFILFFVKKKCMMMMKVMKMK